MLIACGAGPIEPVRRTPSLRETGLWCVAGYDTTSTRYLHLTLSEIVYSS